MPEYLAPGVYVEETSFRSKSIEGVSTTTTGFVGPCRYGPVTEPADVITSLGEFERTYAGGGQLELVDDFDHPKDTSETDNFLWHAARAFFTEGGKRLYVARVFRPLDPVNPTRNFGDNDSPLFGDGHGRPVGADGRLIFRDIDFQSRFPGAASNLIVRAVLRAGANVLGASKAPEIDPQGSIPDVLVAKFGALNDRDVVLVTGLAGPGPGTALYTAEYDPIATKWMFRNSAGALHDLSSRFVISSRPREGSSIYVITVSITVLSADRLHDLGTWSDLPLDPAHRRAGAPDSIFARFSVAPATISEARSLPLIVKLLDTAAARNFTGLNFLTALAPLPEQQAAISDPTQITKGFLVEIALKGGNDGLRPGSAEYEGVEYDGSLDQELPIPPYKTGLKQFEDVEDISIVAAPGCTAKYDDQFRDDANSIIGQLIAHAQLMKYRIAVIDSPPKHGIADVRKVRAKLDSSYAAFYYPWVTILDPVTRRELNLPPSGFVAGIYARNDINRAVYKAPANEVVSLAIGFEQTLNKAQQEVLNPEGINCFRFFEGRGFRLWGARTASSDPEWKYVNLRRYFAYLERSIDKGTQWAVFEPNGEQLWANVRRTVEDFLLNEWTMGALLGDKPEKAYFVKCDRSTMTQNDLDNGRLICLVGVAALRPAEFVIFRIGQWTGDRKA